MATPAKFPAATLALADVGGEVVNFGELVLNTSIISSTTSIVSTTGIPSGWPQVGFISIDNEVIKHTSWTGSTFTTVVSPNGRGFDNTTAGSHTAGAAIKMADTALRFNQPIAEIIAIESELRRTFSVLHYGAVGDGVANDTAACQAAIDAAAVAGGTVYFPPGIYAVTTLTITDKTTGIVLRGAGKPGTGNNGSTIVGPNAVNPVVVNISGASSGSVGHIVIRDLQITYNGFSTNTTGLRLWNCLHFVIENVIVYANGIATTIQGSGNGVVTNLESYLGQTPVAANAAVMIGNGAGALTSPGPLAFIGGQFAGGGANGTPALRIADSGAAISCIFSGTMFQASGGGTGKHTVYVDGTYTSVTFNECYAESTYNSANDGATYIIGNTTKAAAVKIIGGDYWGHGNGVNYQQDFVRVVDCKQFIAQGIRVDRLAATNGFSRAMFRFESTAMDAGDFVLCIANDKGNINGTTYSDGGTGRGLGVTSYNGAFVYGGLQGGSGRTRNFSIPIQAATLKTGSPVLALSGGNNWYAAWALDSAATETVIVQCIVPEDFLTADVVKIWWTNLGAGAGNVSWLLQQKVEADAGDLNTSGDVNQSSITVVAAPAQHIVKVTAFPTMSAAVASRWMSLAISRLGADAGDTLANDVGLVAIEFEYTADL